MIENKEDENQQKKKLIRDLREILIMNWKEKKMILYFSRNVLKTEMTWQIAWGKY
jgi:hypothetical protein